MKLRSLILCLFCFSIPGTQVLAQSEKIDQQIESLISKMTLDEKIGQLNQYNGDWQATGPVTDELPMTFPRSEGQIPVYYNYLNTGRPATGENDLFFRSAYIDLPNSPQYAFGHGLSYTTFKYSNLKLSSESLTTNDSITVSFVLQNSGKYAGEEVVQLYIRDMVSQPVRPVKELKDFQKLMLKPGESRTVTFAVDKYKLAFYNDSLDYVTQEGEFHLMIGSSSDDIRLDKSFFLTK